MSYACAGLSKRLVNFSDVIEKKLSKKTYGGSYSLEELDHAIDLTTDSTASENEKNIIFFGADYDKIEMKKNEIEQQRIDIGKLSKETDQMRKKKDDDRKKEIKNEIGKHSWDDAAFDSKRCSSKHHSWRIRALTSK